MAPSLYPDQTRFQSRWLYKEVALEPSSPICSACSQTPCMSITVEAQSAKSVGDDHVYYVGFLPLAHLPTGPQYLGPRQNLLSAPKLGIFDGSETRKTGNHESTPLVPGNETSKQRKTSANKAPGTLVSPPVSIRFVVRLPRSVTEQCLFATDALDHY